MTRVDGLHHVTALSGSAQRNLDFYRDALGLRLVKKTVNFDDPSAYHLYYGDAVGSAGTIMTFFPWEGIATGQPGAGQATITQFAAPQGALDYWGERIPDHGGRIIARETVFGEQRLVAQDPDGLLLAIVATSDPRDPWTGAGVDAPQALRGVHGVTLALNDGSGVEQILTGPFGYTKGGSEPLGRGNVTRFTAQSGGARIIDLHVDPSLPRGREGAGSVHHVAFSVPDRAAQDDIRRAVLDAGLQVTPQIDRDYFTAIYFRTPGGILFEVATEEPGFATDEAAEALGTSLQLPERYRPHRTQIEAALPPLSA